MADDARYGGDGTSARKNSVLKPEELDARDHEVKTELVEKICAIDW